MFPFRLDPSAQTSCNFGSFSILGLVTVCRPKPAPGFTPATESRVDSNNINSLLLFSLGVFLGNLQQSTRVTASIR